MSTGRWEDILVQACAAPSLSPAAETLLATHPSPLVRRSWALRTRQLELLLARGEREADPEALAGIVLRSPDAAAARTWARRLPRTLRAVALGLRPEAPDAPLEADSSTHSWLEGVVEAEAAVLHDRRVLQSSLVGAVPSTALRALAAQLEPPAAIELAVRVNEERGWRGMGHSLESLRVLAALPRGCLVRSYAGGDELEQPADRAWREGCDALARLDECVAAASLAPLQPLPQGERIGWSAAVLGAAQWRRDLPTLHLLAEQVCEAECQLGLTSAAQLELRLSLERNPYLDPSSRYRVRAALPSAAPWLTPASSQQATRLVWTAAPAARGLDLALELGQEAVVLEAALRAGGSGGCEVLAGLAPSYEGTLQECLASTQALMTLG